MIAITTTFLVLSGIVVYVLFTYQKKRFQHKHQLMELQKQFNEALLASQLEIQEHDFNMISQEIHDNVGQVLSLAKIQLNIIGQSNSLDGGKVNDVKDNIAKAMTDLRDIAKSLNGERIQKANFCEAVKQEVDRITRSGFIFGTVNVEGLEKELNQQKKLIAFRIIQEALQNILKHSNATTFFIEFCYSMNDVQIKISDNGNGFDPAKALAQKQGLGLSNMVGRCALIGGAVNIQSSPGKGTILLINFPYD